MIKVINRGLYSTVQDFGRENYQDFGVPFSGVMDRKAAAFANAILGNKPNTAVLEMTMLGAKLLFTKPTLIAISGANMSPKLNNKAITINKAVAVNSGDILSFGKLQKGFRCYLAVLGGIKSDKVLGSQSMYSGITKTYVLENNDEIEFDDLNTNFKPAFASIRFNDAYLEKNNINVFKGPEFNLLTKEQQGQLLSQEFSISKDNNRMAYQLNEVLPNNLKPIITSLVLPGTVQLTPAGKLIILMRDCQTTGGYPRVLQLSEASINVLSQKFTHQKITFNLKY
ncbi:5-oxoprolinase subunit C family protein [Neotamlana laminarinivorans]|uniref:Biotin-dependent carboxyltransferase family protein n=1 Tax=Neotamlana laminarinivorans TaxID=2883124 RepID=A0A9X1HZ57_9FLAO|nr:biotin-dependent carboxyltransferase family protein [Tamlana laminarinivorans]MCB4797317.1 biotin-dependent carboxyltransferase family protein [Tamlana laminarinivorans]